MPRVTVVKSARKAPGSCGKCGKAIAKGESYQWWKFRYGGTRIRCIDPTCAPKASDLTQSAFYGTLYDLQEQISDACGGDVDALADELESIAAGFRDLGSECEDSLNNMPEGLQQGDTGQLLQERVDKCEEIACDLESAASEIQEKLGDLPDPDEWKQFASDDGIEREEGESDEDYEARVREAVADRIEEIRGECIDLAEGVDTDAG